MEELILSDLNENAKFYQLEGVEFTQDDVDYVNSLIANGASYEDAIRDCLEGIYDVLNEDVNGSYSHDLADSKQEETLMSDKEMVEWAGVLKELYNSANSVIDLADCADKMSDFIDEFLKVYEK